MTVYIYIYILSICVCIMYVYMHVYVCVYICRDYYIFFHIFHFQDSCFPIIPYKIITLEIM